MRARNLEIAADEAFSRAAGAPLILGNRVRLLRNATENYPAWIDAIRSAGKWIHFETYIIHDDETGRMFAGLLAAKAKEGVKVRLLYDWIGAMGNWSGFFRRLKQAGVEVRAFNPPRFDSPLGWVNRDHRKMLSVDGRLGYVTGLCVGESWVGNHTVSPAELDAWRDTGVEVEGPAVSDIDRAFAETWTFAGGSVPANELPLAGSIPAAGDVAVRVVASAPSVGPIYRTDQLVAALARRSLWLADAYFIGTSSYVQALRSAAQSGVDVRLLIPGVSDIPVIRAMSRAGLRPLLEAGVRVFEWNGVMMHAKTAVADGYWARVGSTNLNLVSWVGNWELDVMIEDEGFARSMEAAYLHDMSHSTEIVLDGKPRPAGVVRRAPRRGRQSGSAGQTAARLARLSHAVGAAITNRRQLGPAERVIMYWGAGLLAVLSAISIYWPRGVAFPIAFLCAWISASLIFRAIRLSRF
ncbi:MAG TPA: phospholipase D-like domain-containing protein [Terriglobia bacterium]|jgi:cardiolipin synthase